MGPRGHLTQQCMLPFYPSLCFALIVERLFRSYGYSNPMGYQNSDFRLLWTIPPNPQHPSPP